MSETGATAEQIEAAVERRLDSIPPLRGAARMRNGQVIEAAFTLAARYLVPEGMVIANAADVLSPELRAAIGRIADDYWLIRVTRGGGRLTSFEVDADLALLRAASEGSAS